MKITPQPKNPLQNPPNPPKNPTKQPTLRRKPPRTPSLSKKSGPPTPLLRWKYHEGNTKKHESNNNNVSSVDVTSSSATNVGVSQNHPVENGRKHQRDKGVQPVSARKLAAALWRMQATEGDGDGGDAAEDEDQRRRRKERSGGDLLGFMPEVGQGGDRLVCHHASRDCGYEAKDAIKSPCSVNGPMNGYMCERQSPLQFSNYAMEGATKWDPVCSKASNENLDDMEALDQQVNAASMISALEAELEQSRTRIEELESERRSSKKKVEHFLKKLSEERAAWRSREHEKVRAIIDDVQGDLNRERKSRQRLEIVNSKLVNELAEVKYSAKRYIHDYEKERKSRVLIEEVCDELAKEIGEDKAEVNSLRKECMKIREEVDDERKMLQMAEVWREERVQMKLVDAKLSLHHKYSQMNQLVSELERFLRLKGGSLDVNEIKEADFLRRAAASVNIQDVKGFVYEPSNPGDIYAMVDEMAMAESNEREIEPCSEYSPKLHNQGKGSLRKPSNLYVNRKDDVDDDGSGWETVSHAEDQGSCYSPEGSIMSVNKMLCCDSNASGSFTEWEEQGGGETPMTEISEVCSVQSKQAKKIKSITRLFRSGQHNGDNYKVISVDGINGKLSNGRVSNGSGSNMSPDRGSGMGGSNPSDMAGWSSPDSGNPHINRGGVKGCIEWPRGAQNSLKHKLLEAKMESQKIQLRQVLKQKM